VLKGRYNHYSGGTPTLQLSKSWFGGFSSFSFAVVENPQKYLAAEKYY
jgi:hypothetical protein